MQCLRSKRVKRRQNPSATRVRGTVAL